MTEAKESSSEAKHDCVEVCSLPPAELDDRAAMIRREIVPLARTAERLPSGRAWTFARDAALQSKLESLIAFERRCCSGLSWNLDVDAETIRLRVEGLDPDASFFAPLTADATASGTRRIKQRSGADKDVANTRPMDVRRSGPFSHRA